MRTWKLLSLQLSLHNAKGIVQQVHLLFHVTGFKTRRYTRTWVSSGVHDMFSIMMFGFIEQCLDSWLREAPCSRIQWLFLTPDNRFGVRVAVEVLLQLRPWEWIQLFYPSDGSVLELVNVICPVFMQGNIDLARAKNDTIDFLWWGNRFTVLWIRDDPLEV